MVLKEIIKTTWEYIEYIFGIFCFHQVFGSQIPLYLGISDQEQGYILILCDK